MGKPVHAARIPSIDLGEAHRFSWDNTAEAREGYRKFWISCAERELVEAAGVEPASENVTGQETTCLFTFMPQALGVATLPKTFAVAAQNGQETVAASLKS